MLIKCNISAPPPYPVPENDPFPDEDEQKPLVFPTKAVNEMAPPMPDMPEMDPYVPPGDKDLPPLMSPMGPPGKNKNIKDFQFSIDYLRWSLNLIVVNIIWKRIQFLKTKY